MLFPTADFCVFLQVSASNSSQPLIATSSADHVAALWSTDRDSIGRCLLKYEGHQGSVNSVKFHPAKDLLLTGSGDNTAHIWAGAVNLSYDSSARRGHGSSEEELEDDMLEEPHMFEERERIETLRTPVQEFAGHTSVVVAADWISSNDSPTQIITASWVTISASCSIIQTTPMCTLITGPNCDIVGH